MVVPLYQGVAAVPVVNAPPWIQTITGRFASSHPGVHTLSVRQSSLCASGRLPAICSSGEGSCGAIAPKSVAARTPDHARGGLRRTEAKRADRRRGVRDAAEHMEAAVLGTESRPDAVSTIEVMPRG